MSRAPSESAARRLHSMVSLRGASFVFGTHSAADIAGVYVPRVTLRAPHCNGVSRRTIPFGRDRFVDLGVTDCWAAVYPGLNARTSAGLRSLQNLQGVYGDPGPC